MKTQNLIFILFIFLSLFATASADPQSLYSFTVKDAKNNDVKLSDYKGKVVLVSMSQANVGIHHNTKAYKNYFLKIQIKDS